MSDLADPIEAAGSAAVVASAIAVGLIESLSDPAPAAEHATRLELDPEATRLELEALVALGIAEERHGCFGAAEAADQLAPGPSLLALPERGLWAHLPRFLRTGERYARMDGSTAERSAAYKELTKALGRLFDDAARELAAKLAPRERILDVGAGSGVWSLAMAERSAAARITAIDLPQVLPAFEERAEHLGLRDRVDLVAADYHSIELPSEAFDRVLLANVLHLEPPRSARSLLRRVTAALAPGGELVVIDALLQGDPARDRARSIYALHLAMRTTRGRVHPRAEVERWCREAGLREGELVTLNAPPRALGALLHRRPTRRSGAESSTSPG
jgi:ubiquinone/menaquinone biosynthesis C-methylase UbiE